MPPLSLNSAAAQSIEWRPPNSDAYEKRCALVRFCLCPPLVLGIGFLSLILGLTLPYLPSGTTTLCNSDVVLMSTFDPSTINQVDIKDSEGVSFYQAVCSEMRPFRQILTTTRQFNITRNGKGSIDEFYLTRGSSVAYNFTVSKTSSSNSSFDAEIYVLTNLQSYLKFLRGEKFTSRESVFLSPNEHTLLTSSDDKDSYHFVVWKGFNNSTVSYTVSEDISMYDTTNLHPTLCNSSPCSLLLHNSHKHGDICLLASRSKARHCTTHRYYSKSDKHDDQSAAWLAFTVIVYLCGVIFWCCCFLCCTYTCCTAIKDVLRDPKAKRVKTTQTSTK